MTPDPVPEMHLIDVVVQSDPSGFLIATSRHLPRLLVVATCNEELASHSRGSFAKRARQAWGRAVAPSPSIQVPPPRGNGAANDGPSCPPRLGTSRDQAPLGGVAPALDSMAFC